MNSKIQRQACKWWWLNVCSASCGNAKIDEV
jgi:hypothetical protein